MKNIKDYILEAKNSEGYFMGRTSMRVKDDFTFNTGEKVLLMQYKEHHHQASCRGIFEVSKVNKNSVVIKDINGYELPDYAWKYDKYGITKSLSPYNGSKEKTWWVLYTKDMLNEEDIVSLLSGKSNMWGFGYGYVSDEHKKSYIEKLKKCVDEMKK